MKVKVLLFFIYLLFVPGAFASELSVENSFNIKTGLAFSRIYFNSDIIRQNKKDEESSESTGFGFNTSAGYRWSEIELMVGSDALFGKLNDMTFQVNSGPVRGDGSFRIFSVSPMFRYYTPYSYANRWNLFMGAGPSWSLHTFIISTNLNGSDFNSKKRINFENRGGSINIGVEEVMPLKSLHPSFIELGYSYMRSHQVFIVDASDFKDAKTLSKGNSKDFYGHYFSLRFGITLF